MFKRPLVHTALAFGLAPLLALALHGCGSDSATDASDNDNPTTTVLHDEASDGDITDDPNTPLPLQLAIGRQQLSASVVAPDLDYITINIPAGAQLTAITLDSYDSTNTQSFSRYKPNR